MPGSQYIQILFGPPVGIEGQGIQTNQEGQQGNQQTQDSDNNGEEGKDSDKAGQKGKDKNGKKRPVT